MKMKYMAALLAAAGLWIGQAFAGEDSTLGATSYDAESKVLTVSFSDGDKYAYAEVPQATVDELNKAESKGEYFNKNIRGKYTATKVSE